MSASQVEGVAAVDVVVEGLLDQILRLVARQVCNPEGNKHQTGGTWS